MNITQQLFDNLGGYSEPILRTWSQWDVNKDLKKLKRFYVLWVYDLGKH